MFSTTQAQRMCRLDASRYSQPFTPKISLEILLTVFHTGLLNHISSENVVLDQLVIPQLLFFLFFITCLYDTLGIL